jgi:plasmid maintenance system antidote protein VapI
MTSRKYIANILGITEQYLSMLLNSKREVSWIVASRLTGLFPGKTIQQWKNASPAELKQAFSQLPINTKEVA